MKAVDPDADILVGAIVDNKMEKDELKVTVFGINYPQLPELAIPVDKKTIKAKTEEQEIADVIEILKKRGVRYSNSGCMPRDSFELSFDFEKMEWQCDESFDRSDHYHPHFEKPDVISNKGIIPEYAVVNFARKILFVQYLDKKSNNLYDSKMKPYICDASSSSAYVLGRNFRWIPAAVGGAGDVTSSCYYHGGQKNLSAEEYLEEYINVSFYNLIAKTIFSLFSECLKYMDKRNRGTENDNKEAEELSPVVSDYRKELINDYEKGAEQRNINAITFLAQLYEYGVYYQKDEHKAFELYFKAARWGSESCVKRLLQASHEGKLKGVPEKEIAAWQHYIDSDRENRVLAEWYESQGGQENMYSAVQWYTVLMVTSKDVNFKLGSWYLTGENVEQDYKEASFHFLFCSIEQNRQIIHLIENGDFDLSDSRIQFLLAELYENIIDDIKAESEDENKQITYEEIKNYSQKTFHWLEKAAGQGNTKAMIKLGNMYLGKTPRKALKWFEKAANIGDNEAVLELARLYADGNFDLRLGKKKALAIANSWFSKLPFSVQVQKSRLHAEIRRKINNCGSKILSKNIDDIDKNKVTKQHRNRYGIRGGNAKKGDFNQYLFLARTHDYVLFFTNKGRVYMLRGYQIPEAGRWAKGTAIINLLQLSPSEKITAVINVSEFEDKKFLFMATNKGTVKRCKLTDFSSVRKNGLKAIGLNDGEELIGVKITDGQASVLLATHEGMAIHFDEQDVRCMNRAAHGVQGINLYDGDYVVAMDVVFDESSDVLSVTENGIGKRTHISEHNKQKRGGRGRISYKLTRKTGMAAGMCIVHSDDQIFLFTAKGYVLCVDVDVMRKFHRATQGVIMMKLHEGDKVTSIAAVKSEDDIVKE